ncbi:MAG: glycosyltransferase family 39 protein [Elusimicrobia bacterium]|nr:glycosyltransferase family 39 protein [Elusimicrobiota bacterium]
MPSKPSRLALAGLLAAGTAAALSRPGDAPWIYDEPRLIVYALQNLRAGVLPWHGILGSHGVLYGPFALWVYQTMLLVTRDLFAMVRLHALLFGLGCAGAVWWLARLEPELDAMWGGAALLSPYFWLYGRMLWDNTFLIPLSGLAVCLYISFGRKPRAGTLALLVLALSLAFLTHLMSLILIVPIAAHALWRHGHWLRERRVLVLTLAAGSAALCAPYLLAAAGEFGREVSSPMGSAWRGWLFPLLGGRLFSGLGFGYFLGDDWPVRPWGLLAARLSALALPLVWGGMALAARRVSRGLRRPAERDSAFQLSLLGLGTVFLQCAVYGLAKVYGHPHYLGVAWIFNLYFLWSAVSALGRWRDWTGAIYAAALAAVLVCAMADVRAGGGTRGIHYGPTLANQLEVARALGNFKPGPLSIEVSHYQLFPQALSALMDLYELKGNPAEPPRELAVVYARPNGSDGRIQLVVRD